MAMADWSGILSQLYARNPGLFGGDAGAGGILGSVAANGAIPQGILSGYNNAPPQGAPSPPGVQPRTISPDFADNKAMGAMPGMNISADMLNPPSLQGQNQAPAADDGGNFWSRNNPDGTSSYLGGFVKYDPTKDIAGDDSLGLFGAALADAGAQFSGHPADAVNLTNYKKSARELRARQMLSDAFTGSAAPSHLPTLPPPGLPQTRLGDGTSGQDSTGYAPAETQAANGNGATPTTGSTSGFPQMANTSGVPQGQFNYRARAPQIAAALLQAGDTAGAISLLKDSQPKFSTDTHWTQDGRPYLISDQGAVQWLDPSVTPREKIEIAGNGQAYNPYAIQPGADFSDKGKPFNTATGAPNKPVQDWEIHKAVASRQPQQDTGWQVVNDPGSNTPYRYNSRTAQATDLQGRPIQVSGYGKISASNDFGLSPDQQGAIDKAVHDGTLDPTRLTRGNAKTIASTLIANPGADIMNLHAYGQTMGNAGVQKSAQSVARIPEMLRMVSDSGKALKYDDVKFIGGIQKWKNGQMNDPAYVRYMTQRNDALLSMAGAFRGTGATDMATKLEEEAASPTMSPRAMDAWMHANNDMIQPTLDYYKNFAITNPRTNRPVNTQATIYDKPGAPRGPISTANLPRKTAPSGVAGGVKWKIVGAP